MNSIGDVMDLIKTNNNAQLDKLVNENPSLIQKKTPQGISLLQFAAYCRNQPAIDILRKHRQTLDIFEAASIGDIETVKGQIATQPKSVNRYATDGFTPLGLASFFGHHEIVMFLLDKGANPNLAANNQFQVTPLHSACAISNYEIAETLLRHGADVNARQMNGVTPLHSAAHNGQTALAKLLIDQGADINAETDNGQVPCTMAEEKDFLETAMLIKSQSLNRKALDKN